MESTISNPYQTPTAEVMEVSNSGLDGILPRFINQSLDHQAGQD